MTEVNPQVPWHGQKQKTAAFKSLCAGLELGELQRAGEGRALGLGHCPQHLGLAWLPLLPSAQGSVTPQGWCQHCHTCL